MISTGKSGMILPNRDGYYRCPFCSAKLIRANASTSAARLPIYCRRCKRELLIDIERGQSYLSRSPGETDTV